jgi:hypothetical protein
MTHLSPEELLDVAEGLRSNALADHLASCGTCRRQVADLRVVMTAVSGTVEDVPEPSPLFWDHLSARVRDGIVEDPSSLRRFGFAEWRSSRTWWAFSGWGRVAALASVAAAAFVVVVLLSSRPAEPPTAVAVDASTAAGPRGSESREGADDASLAAIVEDPAFGVISDLAGNMDMDTAVEAGLASAGSAEHAVMHMTSSELTELQRLLSGEAAGKRVS